MSGCWLLVDGCWLLVDGCWLFVWLLLLLLLWLLVVVLVVLLLLFRSISVELLQSALVQKAGHLRRVDSQLGAPIVRLCRIVRLSWGAPLLSEHSQYRHTDHMRGKPPKFWWTSKFHPAV